MRFHNRNFFHKNADLYRGTITKSSSDGQTSGNEFIPSCPAPFSFTKYHSTFCNSIYVFFYYLIKLVANIVPSLKKESVNFKTVGSPSSLCPLYVFLDNGKKFRLHPLYDRLCLLHRKDLKLNPKSKRPSVGREKKCIAAFSILRQASKISSFCISDRCKCVQNRSQCVPLNKTCKGVFGQLLSKTTSFLVSQIDQQIAAARVSKRDLKVLSFPGYQLSNKLWTFKGGLIPSTI